MIYLLFGLGGALAWDKPNAVASLNWTTYTSCGDGWEPCASSRRNVIGATVKYTVVLFPVVTVCRKEQDCSKGLYLGNRR
jgi:hypothetical protein